MIASSTVYCATIVYLQAKVMSGELTKLILFASLFDAIVHGHETLIDHDDSDFSTRSYHKPSSSNEDFDYFPDFQEYLSSSKNKYPTFNRVPVTQFSCRDFAFPGYYADMVSGCQAYYLCTIDGRRSSFLCPNQTIFNQQTLVCDWWYNVDCRRSKEFYHLKAFKLPSRTPTHQQINSQPTHQQINSQPIHQQINSQPTYKNSDFGSRIYNNNNHQDHLRKPSLDTKYSRIYDRYRHNLNRFEDRPLPTDGHNAHLDNIRPEYDEPVKQSYRIQGELPPLIPMKVNSDIRNLDYGAKTFKPEDYRLQSYGPYGVDSRGHQGPHPYEGLPYGSSTQSTVIDHKILHREKLIHRWKNNNSHL